jgi:hypothetical protein
VQHQKFQLKVDNLIANLKLLDIQGYDMVLGVSWMKQVRPVTFDFVEGTCELRNESKPIKLISGGQFADANMCE